MVLHSITDYSYAYATSLGLLNQHGITLTTGTDFQEYKSIMAKGRPDHSPGLPFDADRHGLDATNGIWVIGHDEEGTLMHTQALRLFDLKNHSLSRFLQRNFCAFRPATVPVDQAKSLYRPGPGAHRITGKAVYHGDVWLGGVPGRYRGTGMSAIMGRVAFATAMRTFNPNYIFGFMAKSVAQKGFPERQGYFHSEPNAITYALPDGSPPLEGFMVYMGREDMRFVLDLPLAVARNLAA